MAREYANQLACRSLSRSRPRPRSPPGCRGGVPPRRSRTGRARPLPRRQSRMRSEKPLITAGVRVKSGPTLTMPKTRSHPVTRSRSPRARCRLARIDSAVRRAASYAWSSVISVPTFPVSADGTVPFGSRGPWPETNARPGRWSGHSRTQGKGSAMPAGAGWGRQDAGPARQGVARCAWAIIPEERDARPLSMGLLESLLRYINFYLASSAATTCCGLPPAPRRQSRNHCRAGGTRLPYWCRHSRAAGAEQAGAGQSPLGPVLRPAFP